MVISLIGVGAVGGALSRWFKKHTDHGLRHYDPAKQMLDDLGGSDAVFISVPVPTTKGGQDLSILVKSVGLAKRHCDKVFIRSSVLPGTSDALKTIACPEFLTMRRADIDMERLDILVGDVDLGFVETIFPGKNIRQMHNREAELAKFAHNCAAASKVNFFNMIHSVADKIGADYDDVMRGVFITGYIEDMHTLVPGPDGFYGYGNACFPGNMSAMREFLNALSLYDEEDLFKQIIRMNSSYRLRDGRILHEELSRSAEA